MQSSKGEIPIPYIIALILGIILIAILIALYMLLIPPETQKEILENGNLDNTKTTGLQKSQFY